MVSSNDPQIRDALRMLRAHGWTRNLDRNDDRLKGFDVDPRYAFVNWGFNVRPTELQAGFGIEQLKKLPAFNSHRDKLANLFFEALERWPSLKKPVVHPDAKPAWFALPLMIEPDAAFTRKQLTEYLENQGVETRPIVAGNIAKHPVSQVFPELHEHALPGADQVHARGFYIGLSPMSTEENMERLIGVFDAFMTSAKR